MVHSAEDGSIPVPDMSAIIARLEAAAGGSQALTDDTLRALGFVTKRYPMDSDRYWIVPGHERHPLPPWCDKITVSLDAALALAERALGEACALDVLQDVMRLHDAEAVSIRDLPRLICIAILKAKAQGEGG